jgi:hypothetical protein
VTAGGRAVVVAGAVVRVGFTAVFDAVLTAVVEGTAVRASALVAVVAAAAEVLESGGAELGSGARPQAAATSSTRTIEGITLFIGHHLSVT